MSLNTLLVHNSRRANSAADFFSSIQTDPDFTLQITLTDHVPKCEIQLKTEAKAPNASLTIKIENTPISKDKQPVTDEPFIKHWKAHGPHEQFSAVQLNNDPDVDITGLFPTKEAMA